MKASQHNERVIALILEYVEKGGKVEEVCRVAGISAQTFHRWQEKYRGLTPAEISQLNRVEDETKRLRQLLATLIVKTQALEGALPAGPSGMLAGQDSAALPISSSRALTVRSASPSRSLASQAGLLLKPLVALASVLASRPGIGWLRAGASRMLRWLSARSALASARSHHVLLLLFGIGILGGFGYGVLNAPVEEPGPPPVPVDASIQANARGNSYGSISSTMDRGWGDPESWGTWMSGEESVVLLGFDGPARGDVELFIEARSRPVAQEGAQSVVVYFNDQELGRWMLPDEPQQLRRRFIVPRDVFNASTVARLVFAGPATASAKTPFGLEALSLRDARFLRNFKGFLDQCETDKLIGWAVASGSAVSVTAKVNGKPIEATFTTVARPDLPSHGLPGDAGFKLTPLEPIAAGSTVEVQFTNGKLLRGTPCTP